ncbi:MAG: 6-phosphofructokinase [Candidatus Poribacteria bacterium]|nr:6-phosphofructokinase [Candidatus Poribacteria bacterium]
MKRIGILTAGGDTPALNATLYGAVTRANALRIEVYGFIKGYNSLLNPRMPYVHLNPLFQNIPELDSTYGGSILGASRDYVDVNDRETILKVVERLNRLGIEGLICVGGDGTLNAMQSLADHFHTVLAPKTIDNDLGLNYMAEPDEWVREGKDEGNKPQYRRLAIQDMRLEDMVNYVTPGYATAVFVSAQGVQRIRTTAESHRRIAIIEVMGRQSGYLALGSAYGQPDIILVPEYPLEPDRLIQKVLALYEVQKNVVIVVSEGIVDESGKELGVLSETRDPAENVHYSGAAEAIKRILVEAIGDLYFQERRRNESANAAIFTRKVGHTQRGGRPILFDRFYAALQGGKAVEMLREGWHNGIAILQRSEDGFYLDSIDANRLRDRWGEIHPRYMHPSFYDPARFQPSEKGIEYLRHIFTNAVGHDDVEWVRAQVFDASHLLQPYHSVNVDVHKRIRYLS